MLKEGDKAPAFKLKDQNETSVALSDYKGKRVILFFYPEDDTPTCTVEACNLRDNFGVLRKRGFAVLGISPDDVTKHKKFAKKFSLPFPLLADPDHKAIDAYNVWGAKQMFGIKYVGLLRTTFVIDEKGYVEKIFRKVLSKNHTLQILNALNL